MKGSLIIVSFFALGVWCGLSNWIPSEWFSGDLSFYALCGLMFSVGLSIGHNPGTIQSFRTLNPRLMLLPISTILGTLSAALLISFALPHRTIPECMAVGSGFGYYSLSSIFITE